MNLSLTAARILRWVGYPVFYLLALLLCVRCTFPYQRVGERAAATYNAAELPKTGRRLEIDSMGGHWLFGIRASGVRFIGSSAPAGDDGKTHMPRVAQLDRVYASFAPLAYLMGTNRVSFGARAGDGSLFGRFTDTQDERGLTMDLRQMPVESIPLLADLVGIPMMGRCEGKTELTFPEKRLGLATGTIELAIDGLELGDGRAKIQGFIALPRLQAGRLDLVAKVDEGRVKIDKFEAKGADFELEVSGQIRLRDRLERSTADLNMRFKFADQYKMKNDVTKGLFGDPEKKIKGALDFDPKVGRAKEPDGTYSWRISGPFAKLSFDPAPRGSAASARRAVRGAAMDPDSESE